MFIKSGINAKLFSELRKQKGPFSRTGLLLRAFADEGDGAGDGGSNSTQLNFEALIAKARQEEKDKLYPRIKKLEDENKALVQSNNDNLIRLGDAQRELEKLRAETAEGESQTVADLRKQLEDAQTEITTLKESTPNEADIRAKVEAEYEVKLYRTTLLSDPENADKILTVFKDEVTGSTKEEIDASFEKAVEKTLQTKKQLGLVDDEGNPVGDSKKKKKSKADDTDDKKKQDTAPPVANPSDEEDEEFDMDYIQSLDPRSPEYAEFRKKMGLR